MAGLTIALNRGRILKECLPLLRAAGIEPAEDIDASRKLVFETTAGGHRLVVMRGSDVPTYVEYGAADVGIVGKDTLLE
jgi:ATP phosphoribosyltransferase